MDPLIITLLAQIPVLALVGFAAFLFRGFQRERQILSNAIAVYEEQIESAGRTNGSSADVERLDRAMADLERRLNETLGRMGDSANQSSRMQEHMSNQKTALKEFGRVLSRTSEQTYTELQAIEARLDAITGAMARNGLVVDVESDAA